MKIARAITLALAIAPLAQAAPPVLTLDGLGPVRLGMTPKAVERALGAKLDVGYPEDYSCGVGQRADSRDHDIRYMFDDGVLSRIDIGKAGGAPTDIRTAKGIGLDSSEDEIRSAYGPRIKMAPHPYLEAEGHYVTVDAPGHRRGFIFETEHGRVTEFRAGTYPSLGYIEGCL